MKNRIHLLFEKGELTQVAVGGGNETATEVIIEYDDGLSNRVEYHEGVMGELSPVIWDELIEQAQRD